MQQYLPLPPAFLQQSGEAESGAPFAHKGFGVVLSIGGGGDVLGGVGVVLGRAGVVLGGVGGAGVVLGGGGDGGAVLPHGVTSHFWQGTAAGHVFSTAALHSFFSHFS